MTEKENLEIEISMQEDDWELIMEFLKSIYSRPGYSNSDSERAYKLRDQIRKGLELCYTQDKANIMEEVLRKEGLI